MPYSGPSDSNLPEYVKKLSLSKRKQWTSIWSNATAKGKSESEAFQLANGVVMGKKASEIVDQQKVASVLSTKSANDLPDSAFLYISPGGSKDAEGKTTPRSLRHLPYKTASGEIDLPHLRNALARIPVTDIPEDVKTRLTARAKSLLEKSKTACEKDMSDMDDEEYAEDTDDNDETYAEDPDAAEDANDNDNDESDEPDADKDDSKDTKKKKASQPDANDVHKPSPALNKKKGPGAAFFKHLASQMKGRYSEEEYGEMVKAARAHAGGKGKAAAKAAMITTSEIADICSYSDDSVYCLFNETNFAEPPDWVTFLPKPGIYSHPEYGKIKITKERNQNFVTNFKNKVYQEKLPIDIEHKLSLSGAVAWVKDMRMAQDGTAQAKLEWNDRGKSLIEGDRFKYFSPAWYDNWEDPATNKVHHDVAIGGAITTRPFFKDANLQPLVASERGLFFQEGKTENNQEVFYFTAFAPEPAQPDNSKGVIMPEVTKKEGTEVVPVDPSQFAELQKNFAEKEKLFTDQIKTLTEANEAKDKDIKTLSEKAAAQEKAARTMRFTEEVKGKVDGGIQWVGKDTEHIEFLESLADKFGEDSKEVKMYVSQQRAHSTQLKEAGLFKEIGSSATGKLNTATEQMNAKAAELRTANPKLTKEQAFVEALNSNPEWYEAYERGDRV